MLNLSVDCYIPARMCTYETLRAGVCRGMKEPMGKGVHICILHTITIIIFMPSIIVCSFMQLIIHAICNPAQPGMINIVCRHVQS